MNLDDLTIGEARQIAAFFSATKQSGPQATIDHGYQIVILDRGFIYVGKTRTDAEWVHIEDARNIRIWGTSKGIGELVNGPLPNTKLDDTGTVRAPLRALIEMISVEESKWSR